jgi:RNA polymerase sigma-70 factor (ECF subfamily)
MAAIDLNEQFAKHRQRLKRMVALRMNPRLRGRVDASDVVQDAYLEAARTLDAYQRDPKLPFFLWLRLVTGNRLIDIHRKHLGAEMRDANREVALHQGALPSANSESLAAQLLGHFTSPSQAAIRAEMKLRLQDALNSMDEVDREVLALRHFEQLNNSEVAEELGLSSSAASKRYLRALERLEQILGGAHSG